jgi:hypothetical protein
MEKSSFSWPRFLPIELYRAFKEYLLDVEYWKLIVASRNVFSDVKFMTRRIIIKDIFQFNDIYTRNVLLPKIQSPCQLKIVLLEGQTLPVLNFPGCDIFITAKKLVRYCPKWANFISNRKSVELIDNATIQLFPPLQNVDRMKLTNFSQLQDINGLTYLKELVLVKCQSITDISCLSNLRKLSIYHCKKIISLNGLGKIHSLIVLHREGLEDISALESNYHVSVLQCYNVTNVTSIWNAISLETDFFSWKPLICSQMSNTKYIKFHMCKYPDASLFSNLLMVSFYQCSIENANGLSTVRIVEFQDCRSLVDLSGLGNGNFSVTLCDCHRIISFLPLNNVPKVKIESCMGLRNFQELSEVSDLTLTEYYSNRFTDEMIQSLRTIRKRLTLIARYPLITSLEGLKNIPEVDISYSVKLISLKGFENGRNERLSLSKSHFKSLLTKTDEVPRLLLKYDKIDIDKDTLVLIKK